MDTAHFPTTASTLPGSARQALKKASRYVSWSEVGEYVGSSAGLGVVSMAWFLQLVTVAGGLSGPGIMVWARKCRRLWWIGLGLSGVTLLAAGPSILDDSNNSCGTEGRSLSAGARAFRKESWAVGKRRLVLLLLVGVPWRLCLLPGYQDSALLASHLASLP